MKMNKYQLDAEDDEFIGVSTCFGHHHAHHQENGTKSTMVYSTGCAAEDSWRIGVWWALVGNGFTTTIYIILYVHDWS
jgi:hypothetical protein